MKLFNFSKRSALPQEEASTSPANTGKVESVDFRSKIVQATSESAALKLAAVYRGVEVISNSIAQLQMEYQRKNRLTECYQLDEGPTRGLKLNYLLQVRPNDRQNAVQFWRQVMQYVIFKGNCIIVPVRLIDGEVEKFVIARNASYDTLNNVYLINDTMQGLQGTYNASDVLHLRNTYTTPDGFMGIGTLQYAARCFNISATNDQLSLDNAAKGGRIKIIVQQKQEPSAAWGRYANKEMEKQAEKLNNDIYDKDVSYLSGDSTITPYSLNAQELQLLESRKFSIGDIARYLGVPRALLFDDSNSNYKSAEAATNDFLSHTLSPRIKEIEAEFNAKLLGMVEYRLHRYHMCVNNLFSLDLESQAAWNKSRIETGLASVNELRQEANMPRIENGDEHYVSTNLAVAGSQKLSGETAAPAEASVSGAEGDADDVYEDHSANREQGGKV